MVDFFGVERLPAVPDATPPAPRRARKLTAVPAPDTAVDAAPADIPYRREMQRQALAARADELAELAARVAVSPPPLPPSGISADSEPDSVEFVVDRWMRYLSDPDQIVRLGIPVGSRGIAVPHGRGVQVRIRVPEGTPLLPAARAVKAAVTAWAWGDYRPEPYDRTGFSLTRDVVGEDPATPFRAAGKTAAAVYFCDPASVRNQLWDRAGLSVKVGAGTAYPRIVEAVTGPRGGEFLIDLPAGLTAADAVKAEAHLQRLFRAPDLAVVPEGVRARIELRTRPAATFPAIVPMEPTLFVRPKTPEQRILAAPNLVLPVGVTRDGSPVLIPLAKRPHTVIAGTSGSGKSRGLLTIITGLCLQGGSVALGDFKGDPDLATLARSGMPGIVHYSTSLGGISRLVLWLKDELALRSALLPELARRGIARPVWDPVVVIIDEWGQGLDELENSPDPRERGAAAAMVNAMSKIFAQGRSFGLYVVISTQHTYASSLPGRIAQNAANRVVVGKPKAGTVGPIEVLFRDDKEAARAAAEGITDGMVGRGIIADQAGRIAQFQAFYGYTPGQPPESASDPVLAASWARTRDALTDVPRPRRFGWRFPDDGSGAWQSWSLFPGDSKTGELPTVADLDVIFLDDEIGRPDPAAATWDWASPTFDPGSAPLNPRHFASPSTRK